LGTDVASPTHGRRPGLRGGTFAIALLTAATLAGGVFAAVTAEAGPERADGTERRRAGVRDAAPSAPSAPSAAPAVRRPVTTVVEEPRVAPLRRVVPPDVLAVGRAPIGTAQIQRISKVGRVRDVIAVAGGAVQLQGRSVNTLAVDPSTFRSWTPPGTAKAGKLWEALAADRFVTSKAAAEQLKLGEGVQYPVVGRTMPQLVMGGSGVLGIPGIDMLVHHRTGQAMGLVPNIAVLVNAPGADPEATMRAVKKILGNNADVVNLQERKYRQSTSGSYLDLYKQAARTCPGLSWTVLAAIGQVESDHGRNNGPSTAGALGPMQFLPSTWRAYGVDGDNDGKADIMNPYDAIPGAARYLCANGGGRGGQSLYNAVFRYNHAHWYVQKVLALAQAYDRTFR
jgi:hypothetical protein